MAEHPSPHPDLAGWAMGRLEPDCAAAFEAHLLACDDCRREAAALRRLPRLLERAAPRFAVPDQLEDRVMATLRGARTAARDDHTLPAPPRRGRNPRRAWAGGLVIAAAAAAVVLLSGGPERIAEQRLALRSTGGEPVKVSATVRFTPVGREVRLDISRLRDPRPDGLYELWFVAPDDTLRRPNRVSGGTFHPDANGRGTVRLLAAADPKRYPRLSVTLERADGDSRRVGREVLRSDS